MITKYICETCGKTVTEIKLIDHDGWICNECSVNLTTCEPIPTHIKEYFDSKLREPSRYAQWLSYRCKVVDKMSEWKERTFYREKA